MEATGIKAGRTGGREGGRAGGRAARTLSIGMLSMLLCAPSYAIMLTTPRTSSASSFIAAFDPMPKRDQFGSK